MTAISERRIGSRAFLRGMIREAGNWIRWAVRLRRIERRNPVLVYQMGKVGSSTVVSTIEHLGLGVPVLHVHTLSPAHLKEAVARQRKSSDPFLHEHLIVSWFLVRKLRRGAFPCRLITLTREPISRAISFVFEDLKKQAPNARKDDGSFDTGEIRRAIEKILSSPTGVADPSLWFDGELRACFGFDVFSQPYDAARGFSVLRRDGLPLLVLRMEDVNRSLPAALSELLEVGADRIAVAQANVGADKWYAAQLSEVKRTLGLPAATLERITGTRYVHHFYPAEAAKLVERWAAGQPA